MDRKYQITVLHKSKATKEVFIHTGEIGGKPPAGYDDLQSMMYALLEGAPDELKPKDGDQIALAGIVDLGPDDGVVH